MPTDSNGVYSLPPGYLATTGLPIVVTQHNPIFEDIQTAITARLMASGANPMTGPLKHTDGGAASPSMTFNTAGNLGFYKTTNGVGVSVGGAKVAEFTAAGLASGGKVIGELFAFTGGLAVPALCVLPVGQTLSRAAYPDLWAFAQAEIATGNTFYNNGDGSTTFGVGDMRGRVVAHRDQTGLVLFPGGATLGSPIGSATHTLTLAQIPTGITAAQNGLAVNVSTTNIIPSSASWVRLDETSSGTLSVPGTVGPPISFINQPSTGAINVAVTSNNTSGQAHPNVQATMVLNYALFAGA